MPFAILKDVTTEKLEAKLNKWEEDNRHTCKIQGITSMYDSMEYDFVSIIWYKKLQPLNTEEMYDYP